MSSSPSPRTAEEPTGPYSVEGYRLEESIGYLIKKVRAALSLSIDREMAQFDISHDQWGILLMISQGDGATAAILSREMACDTGSMTRMIDRLETKGLLSRSRSADDRRVVRLELTESGRRLAEQLPEISVRVMNRHLRGFEQADVDVLKNLLRRMLVNAAEEQMNERKQGNQDA